MTPAIKLLETRKVAHTVHRYEVGDVEETTYGEAVAAALGVEPGRVFKTLVAQTKDGELVVGIVPVDRPLDLNLLAKAAGAKSTHLASPADAERATGYVTGGISPFAQKKRLRTFVDRSMAEHGTIFCSAGRRGLQVEIAPADLRQVTGAAEAELGR